jgi:hypothetical protein
MRRICAQVASSHSGAGSPILLIGHYRQDNVFETGAVLVLHGGGEGNQAVMPQDRSGVADIQSCRAELLAADVHVGEVRPRTRRVGRRWA